MIEGKIDGCFKEDGSAFESRWIFACDINNEY